MHEVDAKINDINYTNIVKYMIGHINRKSILWVMM